MILRLSSFDGRTRDYFHQIPRWNDDEERAFICDYLSATVYNTLSVCGGYELICFADPKEADLTGLLNELPGIFQISEKKRHGFGKNVNVANRMGHAFCDKEFCLRIENIREYSPVQNPPIKPGKLSDLLRVLSENAKSVNCVGIDVGGTDIKLSASKNGRLIAVKEYDWNPSSFSTIDEIIDPILLLARLMRVSIVSEGTDETLKRVLSRGATEAEILVAVEELENRYNPNILDAIGVSFPDIVLHDRIVGGETPKTEGVRNNPSVDYEEEFARLGRLKAQLLTLCRDNGCCHIANDGNIAAFTAAMELAHGDTSEKSVERGVVAHSLGTDLGTGMLAEEGAIPQLSLELYDTWIDLGSTPYVELLPDDMRSTRNENSGLPGASRYLGQAAAYRLAYLIDPKLLNGFIEEIDGILRIRTEPEDMRKPCLEHLMKLASTGNRNAEEVFRQIGRNLAMVTREMNFLLCPISNTRWLFGRFVKSERCFALLREGFSEILPELRLENGGEGLANTPLMKQLEARKDVTVAQFAQAIGAIYYALS